MTNQEIKDYIFNDPDIDNMTDFNCVLRAKLINRHITKHDYKSAEWTLKLIFDHLKALETKVSRDTMLEVREVIRNY